MSMRDRLVEGRGALDAETEVRILVPQLYGHLVERVYTAGLKSAALRGFRVRIPGWL
jgi:hypothetical protein